MSASKKIKRLNLHIYPSVLTHESRILKETKSLVKAHLVSSIIIAGFWRKGLKHWQSLDGQRKIWRVALKTDGLPQSSFWKIFKYIEWFFRIFFRLRQEVFLVNCHSLSTLPLGVVFKIISRAKIVYDTHELETEVSGMSRFRKIIAKTLEAFLIRYVDRTIVVSHSISQWYSHHYHLKNIQVIRNFPNRQDTIVKNPYLLKRKFHIQDDEILFICQGALEPERGIKILLDAFSKTNPQKHLVLMGYGSLIPLIQAASCQYSNIHFQPAVAPEKVITYTSGADVGICLIENSCLSYYYSLPNKLFEYLASGLPVIASAFPEMQRIIKPNHCGWLVWPEFKAVNALLAKINSNDIIQKKHFVLQCQNKFSWQNEEKKLFLSYQKLLSPDQNGIKKTKRN